MIDLLKMENVMNWFKFLNPIFGFLFCPVTIVFLWSIWNAPVIQSVPELIEESQL